MSDFTVFRNKNFASIPTYHLKDYKLSFKAVGLLTKMLLLPPEWDYSLSGLATLNKDRIDSVRSTFNELKYHNYIEIEKLHSEKGTWKYNYIVFLKNLLIRLFICKINQIVKNQVWLSQMW